VVEKYKVEAIILLMAFQIHSAVFRIVDVLTVEVCPDGTSPVPEPIV
jgi:hypothetical protein